MLLCALAFLAGILLVQQQATLPTLWWGILVPFALVVALRMPQAKSLLLPAAFFVAGIFWISLRAGLILSDELAPGLEGHDIWLVGSIDSLPRIDKKSVRFQFHVESAQLENQKVKIPRRIQLSIYQNRTYQKHPLPVVGERWRMLVRLKRPHGFQNPGGFDYEGHLFQKRIRARGYVREAQKLTAKANAWSFARLRQAIVVRFQQLLPDSPHRGILIALATGNRNELTPQQWGLLRNTGTSHLVAISGLHIGIIAGLAFFVFRWLWLLPGATTLYLAAPRFGAIGALVAAFFYAGLAGFSIPTQRALIMLALVLGGLLFLKRFQPRLVFGTALLATLLLDPLAVMSAGFWLSFLAVGLILMVIQSRRAADSKLRKLARIQWALAVGLVPITLYHFQQASLIAPLANFVAVPVFAIAVVPATLMAAATSLWLPDWIASSFLHLANSVVHPMWFGLEWLSNNTSAYAGAITLPTVLAAVAGSLLLLLPRGFPARWIGFAGFLPIMFNSPVSPATGEYRLTLLDVGQGLAVVVQTRQHLLVYDTGPRFSDSFDTGRAVVLPYVRQLGRQHIDTLIISHGDNDHAGGANSILAGMPVRRILSSVPQRFHGATACHRGQVWRWDEVQFEILSPQIMDRHHRNNNSCVLRISSPSGTALIPGDIERRREKWLLAQYGEGLRSDVLVAPHHGSRTSSTRTFIGQVKPELVLLPVGYRNRYRHPNQKVVNRYIESGSRLLDSPASGAIEIKFSESGKEIRAYRQQQRRYWFD